VQIRSPADLYKRQNWRHVLDKTTSKDGFRGRLNRVRRVRGYSFARRFLFDLWISPRISSARTCNSSALLSDPEGMFWGFLVHQNMSFSYLGITWTWTCFTVCPVSEEVDRVSIQDLQSLKACNFVPRTRDFPIVHTDIEPLSFHSSNICTRDKMHGFEKDLCLIRHHVT